MPRPKLTNDRISGPYQESATGRWYVIVRRGAGGQERPRFDDREEAEKFIAKWRAELAAQQYPIGAALTEYLTYKQKGCKPKTLETLTYRLRGFFSPEEDLPLSALSEAHAGELYQKYQEDHAVATHHGALSAAKSFCEWARKKKLLSGDPFVEVDPEGTANTGKPQLFLDEARKFAYCAAKAFLLEKDEGGLAVLLALNLGLRSSEVMLRLVRDVNDEGKLLYIPKAKTKTGVRRIQVPGSLAIMLHRQAKGRDPEARLFVHVGRDYVSDKTEQLCKRAGVPRVTSQGLRGTQATLAMEQGITPHLVAQTLGHASIEVTKAHYAAPGSVESGAAKRVSELLEG